MSIESKRIRSKQRTVLLISVALLLLLAGIQLGLYLYGYEFSADLYVPGTLPTITAIVWFAAAAGACLTALLLPGKTVGRELKIPSSPFTDYAALLTMASLVSAVALPLLWRNSNDPLGALLSSADVSDNTARIMLTLSLVAAALAAIHFLLQFVYRKTHPLGVTAVLLWTGFSALRIYFDMRYLLMSPRRVLHLIALAAVLLFLIGELRLIRGIATPRFYALTAAPAMIFAGADAFTNLALTAMGWITPGSEICTYFVLFSMAIYIASRLYALAKPPKSPAPAASSPAIPADAVFSASEESPDIPSEESPDSETIEEKSPDNTEESPE